MLKKIFYMSLPLLLVVSQSYARTDAYKMTGYYGVQEIFPFDGESYDHEFNEKHLERLPDLKKMTDLASFRVVGERHSVDKDHVYYGDKIVQGADPETFVALNVSLNNSQYYAKDENYVYVEDRVVVGANPKAFRLVASLIIRGRTHIYGLDDKNLFVNGVIVQGIDIKSLTIFETGTSRDKNRMYYLGTPLKNIGE